ncbi:uncharacterized protein LOC119813640 isoform X3 [Arvicola amphibius]|uniref:uncharacterized protein LOC119813640 isoform X3 n=1 Tax=Arvicola amphibius TaxID=1047088 RepID=UPI0018E29DB8|nr:uncharacterized protein LOC119813640 isoform X3 [Arvicola amphibius]
MKSLRSRPCPLLFYPSTPSGQGLSTEETRVLDAPKLEFQAVAHHQGARNQSHVPYQSKQVINSWCISAAPIRVHVSPCHYVAADLHHPQNSCQNHKDSHAWRWWCTPLMPTLRRQRQADLCEFKASLIYKSCFQDRLQSYREILSRKKKRMTVKTTYLSGRHSKMS